MAIYVICPHRHGVVAYASIHQDFVGFPYEWLYLYPYSSSQQHRSYVPIDTEKLLMPAFIRILLVSHMNGSIHIPIVVGSSCLFQHRSGFYWKGSIYMPIVPMSYAPIDTEQLLMPVYIRIFLVFHMNITILCPNRHGLVAYASIHQDFVGFLYEWFYLYPYSSSQQHRSNINGSSQQQGVVAYASIHQDFIGMGLSICS